MGLSLSLSPFPLHLDGTRISDLLTADCVWQISELIIRMRASHRHVMRCTCLLPSSIFSSTPLYSTPPWCTLCNYIQPLFDGDVSPQAMADTTRFLWILSTMKYLKNVMILLFFKFNLKSNEIIQKRKKKEEMVRYSSPMRVQSNVRATREVLKNRGDALIMR